MCARVNSVVVSSHVVGCKINPCRVVSVDDAIANTNGISVLVGEQAVGVTIEIAV